MSVLIKKMEKPKTCADCLFREIRYDPGYYNYEHCKALGKIFNEHSLEIDVFEEKLNDCPLIEIPTPHGRLIDADIMQREAYQKNFDGVIGNWALFQLNYYLKEKAQTILEAEE